MPERHDPPHGRDEPARRTASLDHEQDAERDLELDLIDDGADGDVARYADDVATVAEQELAAEQQASQRQVAAGLTDVVHAGMDRPSGWSPAHAALSAVPRGDSQGSSETAAGPRSVFTDWQPARSFELFDDDDDDDGDDDGHRDLHGTAVTASHFTPTNAGTAPMSATATPTSVLGKRLDSAVSVAPSPSDRELKRPRPPPLASSSTAPPLAAASTWPSAAYAPSPDYTRLPQHTNAFVYGRSSHGTRLFFPRLPSRVVDGAALDLGRATRAGGANGIPLLGCNIHELMVSIKNERELTCREAEEARQRQRQAATAAAQAAPRRREVDTALWVDKFTPRKFIDLVGDPLAHKQVLVWMHQWDFCVFGRARQQQRPPSTAAVAGPTPASRRQGDALDRPEKRLLLLAGPPGLGKTTVAHIVAAHCGYNVVEINASDDRTASLMGSRLMGAISAQNVRNAKPNMVILDEIDGASMAGGDGGRFMRLLAELASERRPIGAAASKRSPQPLLRPIICICNDPWAPVMKPLRPLALMVAFKTPIPKQITSRLAEICRWEGLAIDARTLSFLVEATGGDLRSCLNTLQFMSRAAAAADGATTASLAWEKLAGAQRRDQGCLFKEMVHGELEIVRQMFTLGADPTAAAAAATPWQRAIAAGLVETERLQHTVFENYLRARIYDHSVRSETARSKLVQATDWWVFVDRMASLQYRNTHAGDMTRYTDAIYSLMHLLFATVKGLPISSGTYHTNGVAFPRAGYEAFVARTNHERLMDRLHAGFPLRLRRVLPRRAAMRREVLPLLVHMITHGANQTTLQQLMQRDSTALSGDRRTEPDIVGRMVATGLTWIETALDPKPGAWKTQKPAHVHAAEERVWTLDPPVEQILLPCASDDGAVVASAAACTSLPQRRVREQMRVLIETAASTAAATKAATSAASAAASRRPSPAASGTTTPARGTASGTAASAGEASVPVIPALAQSLRSLISHSTVGSTPGAAHPTAALASGSAEAAAPAKAKPATPAIHHFFKPKRTNASPVAPTAGTPVVRYGASPQDDVVDRTPRIVYHHHEGFSNAVRRPLTLNDLLH